TVVQCYGSAGPAAREVTLRFAAAVRSEGEVGRHLGPAVVVDDVLDHDQRRGLVVVGDGAGLGLAVGDRARAVDRVGPRVAGRPGLGDGVGTGVQGHGRAGLAAREVIGRIGGAAGVEG